MAKVRKLSVTFKRAPYRRLRRRIGWQTGADVSTRTQNARLVYWQVFKKADPNHTSAMIFAALYQALRCDRNVPWSASAAFANYSLYTLVDLTTLAAASKKGLQNSAAAERMRDIYAGESIDKYAVHLRDLGLERESSFSYVRGLRFGLVADKFADEFKWPAERRDLLVGWMVKYGAYTSLNWLQTKRSEMVVRLEDRLLLSLHQEVRDLLPMTFNHVVMTMAYMARRG